MFNTGTEAKQIKYQRIQEDVGGVSVPFGSKKFLEFIAKKTALRLDTSYP